MQKLEIFPLSGNEIQIKMETMLHLDIEAVTVLSSLYVRDMQM
jgi:hypothetical protein